jgi:hypothetical protein
MGGFLEKLHRFAKGPRLLQLANELTRVLGRLGIGFAVQLKPGFEPEAVRVHRASRGEATPRAPAVAAIPNP